MSLDLTDRMMKYVEKGTDFSHSVGYEYDTKNNLTQLVEEINGTKHTASYTYDDDNRIETVTTDGATVTYTYDTWGRLHTKVTKNSSGTSVLTEEYTYVKPTINGVTVESSQIATYKVTGGSKITAYDYTYDDNGNILSVTEKQSNLSNVVEATYITSYVYDSANQLIRENNQAGGFTYTWEYDGAGNITDRDRYAYTTGNLEGVTPTGGGSYVYGNSEWGDLLTEYNGNDIDYDEVGNMVYDGDVDYTWEHGRQLKSIGQGSSGWQFEYNADGMRTKRTDGTTTYSYVYNGSQLMQMTAGGNHHYFTYDADGTPLTVTVNNATYYYVTNIQGDVVEILDAQGDIVATYTYTAWGVCEATGDDPIEWFNPLRYRGYVYDQETGLYYLQSRYYDPEMGRFINADVFTSTGQGFTGNNMFAYCGNNPVNRADKSGCGWTIVLGVAVGAGIGVLTSWIGSLVTNQEFTWVDACIAAVSGGVSYFGPWGLVAGGAINGIYSGITAYNNGASWYGATGIGISSFLFNMLSFGELANAGNDLTGIATSGFIDLIFGTGFSSMDAAISKTVADKTHRSTSSKKPTSALAVITEIRRKSRTRIYNGREITVGNKKCSTPDRRYADPNSLYCYVEL